MITMKKPCLLPSIGLKIDVPIQSFLGCIHSLLTSPELMKSENLIFEKPDDPSFVKPWDSYQYYDEINSGSAYHQFQSKLDKKGYAVQIPLIFFLMEQLLIRLVNIPLSLSCLLLVFLNRV